MKSNNNAISLKNNLDIIPCHVFGDYSICSEDWCGYIKNPENYKSRNLPYSKYLTGEDLLTDLMALFSLFSNNAEKLCSTGSTGSVCSSVAQENKGHESLSKVCFIFGKCFSKFDNNFMPDINDSCMYIQYTDKYNFDNVGV